MADLTLHIAEGEDDAMRAFHAYEEMHAEGLVSGDFHPVKTLANILGMMRGPGSVVFLVMDGEEVAGVLALVENGYWYSEAGRHLIDKGLYVRKAYRNTEALKLMLDAAVQASSDADMPVFITIHNGRRKRGGRSQWERVGAMLGYNNMGATLAHHPE